MARRSYDYATPVRRVLVALLVLSLLAVFVFWRIDSPRAERMRAAFVDRFVPSLDWAMAPVTAASRMISGFQSYQRLYAQNQKLRRELRELYGEEEKGVAPKERSIALELEKREWQ